LTFWFPHINVKLSHIFASSTVSPSWCPEKHQGFGPVGVVISSPTFAHFNFLTGPLTPLITPNPSELTSLLRGFFLACSPCYILTGCCPKTHTVSIAGYRCLFFHAKAPGLLISATYLRGSSAPSDVLPRPFRAREPRFPPLISREMRKASRQAFQKRHQQPSSYLTIRG